MKATIISILRVSTTAARLSNLRVGVSFYLVEFFFGGFAFYPSSERYLYSSHETAAVDFEYQGGSMDPKRHNNTRDSVSYRIPEQQSVSQSSSLPYHVRTDRPKSFSVNEVSRRQCPLKESGRVSNPIMKRLKASVISLGAIVLVSWGRFVDGQIQAASSSPSPSSFFSFSDDVAGPSSSSSSSSSSSPSFDDTESDDNGSSSPPPASFSDDDDDAFTDDAAPPIVGIGNFRPVCATDVKSGNSGGGSSNNSSSSSEAEDDYGDDDGEVQPACIGSQMIVEAMEQDDLLNGELDPTRFTVRDSTKEFGS